MATQSPLLEISEASEPFLDQFMLFCVLLFCLVNAFTGMKSDVYERIRGLKPFLEERFNVSKIGVFGSVSRGEDKRGSDIDILVSFKKPLGWEFIELKDYLEGKLGKRVDLVSIDGLKPSLRGPILKEVIYA